MRHAGLREEECPLLVDWVLFGGAERVRNRVAAISDCFPNALHISHNPGSFPIEANPEAGLTMEEYIAYKPGIVWDTEHVVRSGRHCELPVTSYWERFLPQVAGNIKVIHAKTDPVSNGMVSSKMFKALARETGPTCPIIVECRPKRALTVRQTIKKLKSVREAADYYFSDIS